MSLLAAFVLFAGLCSGAAAADAQAKTVFNGMKLGFWDLQNSAPPPDLGEGEHDFCTLGPVGTDKYGRQVGITAGHCADPTGAPPPEHAYEFAVYDVAAKDFGPIGYTRFIQPKANQGYQDYMVIEFVPGVQLSAKGPHLEITGILEIPQGPGAPNPDPQLNLLGAALGNTNELVKSGARTGTHYGRITNNGGGLYQSWAYLDKGDSGGPAVWHVPGSAYPSEANGFQSTGPWAGIVTRLGLAVPPYVYTSSANILADLKARDAASGSDGSVIGAGFAVAAQG